MCDLKSIGLSVLCFLLFGVVKVSAQDEGVIAGKIIDFDMKAPLPGAHLYLEGDSLSARQAVTDMEGQFSFNNLKIATYTLKCSFLGYTTALKKVVLTHENKNKQELVVVLSPESVAVDEVTVVAQVARVVMRGDTMQLTAAAYKTNADANAGELIEKMPGIVMDGGKIEAQGEQVTRVLVDGKEFMGGDPKASLTSLPAEMIDHIEIFDEGSEQSKFTGFQDGDVTKTINIITKNNKRTGAFGKATSGVGLEGNYLGSGSLHFLSGKRRVSVLGLSNNINQQQFSSDDMEAVKGKGNPFGTRPRSGINTTHSLGVNYSEEWKKDLKVEGSYFYKKGDNEQKSERSRSFFNADRVVNTLSESQLTSGEHRLTAKVDWKLTDKTSIVFRPRISIRESDRTYITDNENIYSNRTTLLKQNGTSVSGVNNYTGMLLVRHRFNKPMRTVSLSVSYGVGDRESVRTNKYDFGEGETNDTKKDQLINEVSWSNNITSKLSYTEPLVEGLVGQLNYEYRVENTWSDKNTYELLPKEEQERLTALSNRLLSHNNHHKAGASLRYKSGRLRANGQVSLQRNTLGGTQDFPEEHNFSKPFNNVLSSAQVRYGFSKRKKLRFSYSGRTSNPRTWQLQELLDYNNPYLLRTGNFDLEASYAHNLSLRYSWQDTARVKFFMTSLRARFVENSIGYSNEEFDADGMVDNGLIIPSGALLRRPVNLDGYYRLSSFTMFSLPLSVIRSNLKLRSSISHENQPIMYEGALSYRTDNRGSFSVGVSSNISEYIDFTVSSTTSLSDSESSVEELPNAAYYNQRTSFVLKLASPKGLFIQSRLQHQYNASLSDDFTAKFMLWNASAGTKLFKNRLGELKLSVYDILGTNKGVNQYTSELYQENSVSEVLQRYFLLSFTYRIRSFGSGVSS